MKTLRIKACEVEKGDLIDGTKVIDCATFHRRTTIIVDPWGELVSVPQDQMIYVRRRVLLCSAYMCEDGMWTVLSPTKKRANEMFEQPWPLLRYGRLQYIIRVYRR